MADSIRTHDPATLTFVDLGPRHPAAAALCLTAAGTTELGGGFVRLSGPMTFDVSYDEVILVVSGTLRLWRGGEECTVPAGTSALIPAGGEVAYDIAGDEPVLFFFVRHPRE